MSPPETQGVVIIDGHRCESSWIANKVTVGRYGADFNVIQDAIDYCDAIGGEWVIELYPRGEAGAAVWDEGDITPNGGAIITLKGMGEDRVRIVPTVAPTVAVVVSAHTLNLEDIIVTAPTDAFPAVRVTAGTFEATSCELNGVGVGDAIQQVGGTVTLHDCQVPVGDIDLRDAACTLILTDCAINGTIDTANGTGANVVMTAVVSHCDCHDQAFNLAATGACHYDFTSCNHIGTITDASLGAGAVNGEMCRCHVTGGGLVKNGTTGWLIDNSELISISNTNATGEISVYGGLVLGIIRAVGSIVWWQDNHTLKVIPCTTITDPIIGWAIAAATAAPAPSATNLYTVHIYPGIYDEYVTCSSWANLKGIGPKGSVVIQQIDGTILRLSTTRVQIEDLTIRLVTPTAPNRILINGSNVPSGCRFTNVILEVTTPAGQSPILWQFTGNSTVILERCYINVGDTNSGITVRIEDTADITIDNCDFTVAAPGHRHLRIVSDTPTIRSSNTRYAGTAKLLDLAAGTVYLSNDTCPCTGAWTNTDSTVIMSNCSVEAPIVAGNGAIVRLRSCSYRAISRAGTGNIVDESPYLSDAPWHVEKWSWQAALANSQVAVRGTPRDDGSGQVLLEVNLDVADVEAVEALPAVGSYPNTFDPAKTPRMITQYLWEYTGAYEHVFIGLRHTPGDAYPVANEDCAGFVYDSTLDPGAGTFFTYTIRGANVEYQPISAPGHAVPIQLEIIIFGGVRVEFYIDGVLVATHITRVPIDALYWQHLLVTDGLGGDTDIDVAIRNGGCQECPV